MRFQTTTTVSEADRHFFYLVYSYVKLNYIKFHNKVVYPSSFDGTFVALLSRPEPDSPSLRPEL